MRVGIADHLGWAVAVVATSDHVVVDRRRIELVEPGVPTMPIHAQSSKGLTDAQASALVDEVRASARRATADALDALPDGIAALALRDWPDDFPTDIAVLRQVPYEARADAVMYRQVLANAAHERGWDVLRYDAKDVVDLAHGVLGPRADEVLQRPRAQLGPPWAKDHRVALAAAIVG